MHITIIIGSIRPDRRSHKPARFIERLLTEQGHATTLLDLKELDLPLFVDSPEQTALPNVERFVQSIATGTAFIVVFPEYNHDVGVALRNAFAFLRNREFLHKPLGLVAVSNGHYGGMRALYAAKGSFPTLGGIIVPTVVSVNNVDDLFPDDQTCADDYTLKAIHGQIKELAAYDTALAEVRTQLTSA